MKKKFKNKKIDEFVDFVKTQCKKHKIRLVLKNDRYVKALGEKVNGYFCDQEKVLAVAINKPINKWFPILVHEYAHMTQWMDNCKEWKRLYYKEYQEDIIEPWLNGEDYNRNRVKKHIQVSRDVELDCEKRTVEIIKEFKLPININEYILMANAYTYFWSYLYKSRKWYTIGKEPYRIKEVLQTMPKRFVKNYDSVPKDVQKAFERYCF